MTIKTYTPDELRAILDGHLKWLRGGPGGSRAYLSHAYLSHANLSGADLSGAYLSHAYLSHANLSRADLSGADLSGAYMSGAYMSGANLSGADLSGAYLSHAYLSHANLSGANLSGADLSGAYMSGADLSGVRGLGFQIPQEGELIVFKKLGNGVVAKLRIPPEARRTGSLIGRKCRAEFAEVLEGEGPSRHDFGFTYKVGEVVRPDSFCDDVRLECAPGIHFFLSREEAEAY